MSLAEQLVKALGQQGAQEWINKKLNGEGKK